MKNQKKELKVRRVGHKHKVDVTPCSNCGWIEGVCELCGKHVEGLKENDQFNRSYKNDKNT